MMLQSPAKESLGGTAISSLSDQNIDNVTVLVDGPPQVIALAADLDEELVHMPDITQPPAFTPDPAGVLRTELYTPTPDRFI